MDFDELRREAESRRIGPIVAGHCSVPVLSIENMGVWALLRDMSKVDDFEFAETYGYWIPKDDK